MKLTVNGADQVFEHPQTVDSLVETMSAARADVAVAVDGRVVPRSAWYLTEVADGASVEVVAAVPGG